MTILISSEQRDKNTTVSTIFNSQPNQDLHTWTITSKLGHILQKAEEYFGERDKSYTILGVEITSNDYPQIWYPGNCWHIAIQITSDCLSNMDRAVFQVAHEVIHCLDPTGGKNVTVLEEGLATLFSIKYCNENGHGQNWSAGRQSYTDASELVNKLLAIDCDIIKKLRAHKFKISLINREQIKYVNSEITEQLVDELTKTFIR